MVFCCFCGIYRDFVLNFKLIEYVMGLDILYSWVFWYSIWFGNCYKWKYLVLMISYSYFGNESYYYKKKVLSKNGFFDVVVFFVFCIVFFDVWKNLNYRYICFLVFLYLIRILEVCKRGGIFIRMIFYDYWVFRCG